MMMMIYVRQFLQVKRPNYTTIFILYYIYTIYYLYLLTYLLTTSVSGRITCITRQLRKIGQQKLANFHGTRQTNVGELSWLTFVVV